MALFGGKSPAELTLTEAIRIGFKMVTQRNFMIPILVIGAILNVIVIVALVPIFVGIVVPSSGDSPLRGLAIVSGILGAVITAIVGGILLNLYGQVWATMASVGEAPTMQATFTRLGGRWMSILGAGLIAGLLTVAIILVGGIVGALLGTLGVLVILAAVVVGIYVGARLSLAGWLAADGAAAMEAVQTSWAMTQGRLLLIVGWGLAFAVVFGIVGSIIGAVLGFIPLVGEALTRAIVSAFGFGAGVSLYRKIRPPEAPSVPSLGPEE